MVEITPLSNRLIDFIRQSSGWFWLQDIYKTLNITRENDKTNIRNQCIKLAAKGKLDKDHNHDGHYRNIQDDMVEMDLHNADPAESLDISYPFKLERFVLTLPRSIIVVAGASNSEKTAWMLNFCMMNQWKHHVVYFCSEMGSSRLKARLNKFPDIQTIGIGFQAFERGGDFHDVVAKFPTSICVIDYLEIYENFYEIGAKIKAIFDKLKDNGIVLIAVQKNPSKKNIKGQTEYIDLGRGGNFGLEKASLYVAMDSSGLSGGSRLKIIKAKEWARDDINPNGLEWSYKLIKGCIFCNIVEPMEIAGKNFETEDIDIPF